jgi:hypothetical protein
MKKTKQMQEQQENSFVSALSLPSFDGVAGSRVRGEGKD